MKILVTGGGGFIGQAVISSLRTQRSNPDAADGLLRQPEGFLAMTDLLTPSSQELDLHNAEQTDAYLKKHKPTHLIHLAWYAEHGKFWNAPENHDWVTATRNLLEAFAKHGGERFVGAGTCAEYAWGKEDRLKENASPLAPANLYGQCKNEARAFVEEFCKNSGIGWAWGRIFFPYGPGEPSAKLIPSLIAALSGKTPPFGINKDIRRDFIFHTDVGAAFKVLLDTKENGVFNIASGQAVSLQSLTETLAELLNTDPARILQEEPKSIDPIPCIIGDMRKMKALGWEPPTGLKDGLKQYLRVFLEEQ